MAIKWISITGSRYYPFTKEVWDGLKPDDQLETIDKGIRLIEANISAFPADWGIVSGGARGPDSWAESIAEQQGRETKIFPAEWEKHGRGAGLKRNKDIVAAADSCLVFWDGESRGTNHFIKTAYKAHKDLFIVGPDGQPWAIFDEEYWSKYDFDPPPMEIPRGK